MASLTKHKHENYVSTSHYHKYCIRYRCHHINFSVTACNKISHREISIATTCAVLLTLKIPNFFFDSMISVTETYIIISTRHFDTTGRNKTPNYWYVIFL